MCCYGKEIKIFRKILFPVIKCAKLTRRGRPSSQQGRKQKTEFKRKKVTTD